MQKRNNIPYFIGTFLIVLITILITARFSVIKVGNDNVDSPKSSEKISEKNKIRTPEITNTENEYGKNFKEEYESINGKENKNGKIHREIIIPENNPFIKSTGEEIVNKINNKESFYVYFGDSLCPWCRSVIEVATDEAKRAGIKTIYYVDIWDEEGNEIFRNKIELNGDNAETVIEGTDSYNTLLKEFEDKLEDYKIKKEDGTEIVVGKRIFAPNFVRVIDGKADDIIDGISEKQEDSRETLTAEIIQDEQKTFRKFFSEGNK